MLSVVHEVYINCAMCTHITFAHRHSPVSSHSSTSEPIVASVINGHSSGSSNGSHTANSNGGSATDLNGNSTTVGSKEMLSISGKKKCSYCDDELGGCCIE